MALYFIGLGLNDEKDITLNGLNTLKKCKYIFLENYTSVLNCDMKKLEKLYKNKIILADREMVEKNSDEILSKAKNHDVAFLVAGDIFSATTHIDLMLRAKKKNIECFFISNASVLNAVGITGLELYKFGKTTSIPFPQKSFEPETPYDVLKENKKMGLHTLLLLDLNPKENKFMSVNEAVKYLLKIEDKRKEKIFTENTLCLGCARLGGNFKIKYKKAKDLINENFGKPLHCLIVPGKLHFVEEEALELWE